MESRERTDERLALQLGSPTSTQEVDVEHGVSKVEPDAAQQAGSARAPQLQPLQQQCSGPQAAASATSKTDTMPAGEIMRLQQELAEARQSLASYETTLQQLVSELGAQTPLPALQQLQQSMGGRLGMLQRQPLAASSSTLQDTGSTECSPAQAAASMPAAEGPVPAAQAGELMVLTEQLGPVADSRLAVAATSGTATSQDEGVKGHQAAPPSGLLQAATAQLRPEAGKAEEHSAAGSSSTAVPQQLPQVQLGGTVSAFSSGMHVSDSVSSAWQQQQPALQHQSVLQQVSNLPHDIPAGQSGPGIAAVSWLQQDELIHPDVMPAAASVSGTSWFSAVDPGAAPGPEQQRQDSLDISPLLSPLTGTPSSGVAGFNVAPGGFLSETGLQVAIGRPGRCSTPSSVDVMLSGTGSTPGGMATAGLAMQGLSSPPSSSSAAGVPHMMGQAMMQLPTSCGGFVPSSPHSAVAGGLLPTPSFAAQSLLPSMSGSGSAVGSPASLTALAGQHAAVVGTMPGGLPSAGSSGGSSGGGGLLPPLPGRQQQARQGATPPPPPPPVHPPRRSAPSTPSSIAGFDRQASSSGLLLQQQQQQQQLAAAVQTGLLQQALIADTAGTLDFGGLGGPAAGYDSLMVTSAALGALVHQGPGQHQQPALLESSTYEADVIAGGAGDQYSNQQLHALQLLLQQQVGNQSAGSAEGLLMLQYYQQLQQLAATDPGGLASASTYSATGSAGGAATSPTSELMTALNQLSLKDADMAAALAASQSAASAHLVPQPLGAAAAAAGASAGVPWTPAAAVGAGLAGATTLQMQQQALQAQMLANLNLQAQSQLELQAYQQAQLAQLEQQQQFAPLVQQMLVAQAAAAAAASAVRQQQQQWQQQHQQHSRGKGAAGAGSSSGRRGSKGTDVQPAGPRDVRKGSSSSGSERGGKGGATGTRSSRSSDEQPDWRRIFVGNIGWWVDEEMLQRVFGDYGTILDAQVMWNTKLLAKGKRVNREFAFISYSTPEEAGNAIYWMHGKYIEGLTKDKDGLTVQYEAQGMGKSAAHAVPAALQQHMQQLAAAAAAGMHPTAVAEQQQQQHQQQLLLEQMQLQQEGHALPQPLQQPPAQQQDNPDLVHHTLQQQQQQHPEMQQQDA